MAGYTALREGLKDRLATIDGLHAYARVPKDIRLPAAVVQPAPNAIAFDSTMARGSDDFRFLVSLVLSDPADDLGQLALDDYLDGSGAKSVKAAIEGDASLGGVAHFARVVGVTEYGDIKVAGVDYVGAELLVEVTA